MPGTTCRGDTGASCTALPGDMSREEAGRELQRYGENWTPGFWLRSEKVALTLSGPLRDTGYQVLAGALSPRATSPLSCCIISAPSAAQREGPLRLVGRPLGIHGSATRPMVQGIIARRLGKSKWAITFSHSAIKERKHLTKPQSSKFASP